MTGPFFIATPFMVGLGGRQNLSESEELSNMAIKGLDHVQLAAPAGCEAEARRFYGELLELPEIPKPESLARRGGAWFRVGAQQIHIGVEQGFQPARKAHPAFEVDDLDALAARLAGAGTPVSWDDMIPDVRRFYAADPWGNRLEFTEGL
jgi:catechol 2,3-dioxygenase-like lactoylglutathione lyase family enzyme